MENIYYKTILDFFGQKWFDYNWREFTNKRQKYSKISLNKEITILELGLHPLLREIFRYQKELTNNKLNFDKIPAKTSSDFILSHLGRDLELLSNEIKERGKHIKKDLQNPVTYENHRFNLMVAAGYKLLGFSVQFVPSKSSKGKTPDLLINDKYFIENKQRNQHESDKPRYEFFGELVETYLEILNKKQDRDLFINIEVFGDINLHKEEIRNALNKKIWRNQNLIATKTLKISYSKLSGFPVFLKILKEAGHFQKVPVFTRTEDSFIASDPHLQNVIMLNKVIDQKELSKGVYDLLEDANSKNKDNKKLITYFDIGRAPSDWVATLSDYIYKHGGIDKYQNIDMFVICQTPIQLKGNLSEIKPNFNLIGNTTHIDIPDKLNFFGFQGYTGMDKYFIKGFLNPSKLIKGSKYLDCFSCGYKMIGIATNLNAGEKLSQVNMPCPQCGKPMDMIIKDL
ncbi:hypothetical protein CANDROIZ_40011 [Candidatus Roizmanbacteria bacterium]|nr:hypothetical protein CANDROIZ_40011 [Candidatus Roizmanbacteria bacterium]